MFSVLENKCENCAHKQVCSYTADRAALENTVKHDASEPRFENFTTEIKCAHFLKAMPTTKSDICP